MIRSIGVGLLLVLAGAALQAQEGEKVFQTIASARRAIAMGPRMHRLRRRCAAYRGKRFSPRWSRAR